MKNLIFILLLVLTCATGCSDDKPENKRKIYLVVKTTDNPFFKSIIDGAHENIQSKYNLQIRGGKDEADVKYQQEVLELISQEARLDSNVAGVILTPSSSSGDLIPAIVKLRKAGIPIVLVDSKIDSALLERNHIGDIPFIGSSNREGGQQAASFVSKLLTSESHDILLLKGVDGQEPAEQRFLGFSEFFRGNNNVRITVRSCNWKRTDAIKVVSQLYSLGKRYDAIFASNDEMALGAYQAIIDVDKTAMPPIVGFDAVDEARESIKKNKLTATIAQNPSKMGREAILLIDRLNAEPNQKFGTLLIPTEIITNAK